MTPEQALNRLERLGSASAIARYLRLIKCTGALDESTSCPIARYVAAESGEPVEITSRDATLLVPYVLEHDHWWLQVGPNVAEFVELFDGREFPELVGDPDGSADMLVTP